MRIMRSGALWAVVLGLAVAAGCKTTTQIETDNADLKKLEGTWEVTDRADGPAADTAEKAPERRPEKGMLIVIKDSVMTWKSVGEPYRQKVSLEAGKDVRHVDLVEVDEKGNRVEGKQGAAAAMEYRQLGAYKLDGDTLTLTLAGVNAKSRPASVGAKEKGQYTLTLKRTTAKADDRKGGDAKKKDDADKKKDEADKKDEKKDDKKKDPLKSDEEK